MIIDVKNIKNRIGIDKSLEYGCIVDTNVIFAASFPLDTYNEWAEGTFSSLRSMNIPIYTNINVRSEFIDLNRRVLIPEGLMDFYSDWKNTLKPEIELNLKSLKTRIDKAARDNKTFKMSDADIKKFRKLLAGFANTRGQNGWDLFCRDYFSAHIQVVWDRAISNLGLKFLGTRAIESKEFFNEDPTWPEMIDIVGRSGIGSSDAMIINLFLKSKLPLIITADTDVRDTVIGLMQANKYVLAP